MKLIAKNITLENIKKSKYWDLIAILVWNHYSEKQYQDESMIEFEENYRGVSDNCSSYNKNWNDPDYTEPGLIRELSSILITLKRSDYITYIFIHTNGNISCFGKYINCLTEEKKNTSPNYSGAQRNLSITNWMIENNLIKMNIRLDT